MTAAYGTPFDKETEMTSNAHAVAPLAALILAASVATADTAAPATANPAAPAGLERLKTLAGEWVSAEDGEMAKKGALVARYAVTASGSAVVETVFPGSAHEMVTVYHADGSDLVLTHYCMEGNQPRMRAKAPRGSRIEFAYDGGTNIDPARDRHMSSAVLDLASPDEIRSQWTELAEGKVAFVAKTHLVRKTH
jgi:hypothetical protein